jgi:hypothetical protein
VLAKADSVHIQPFIVNINEGAFSIAGNIATSHFSTKINADLSTYWTKVTVVYTSDGTDSSTQLFVNQSLILSKTDKGKLLRWSDESTLLIGGYPLSSTTLLRSEKFVGWIDDIAFYNRKLNSTEIANNWMKEADINDASLFIYYNFETAYKSSGNKFKNLGKAGSQADLSNGLLFGGKLYFDSLDQNVRLVTTATTVPIIQY